MKLLSICIPTYNRSEKLIATLECLKGQVENFGNYISIFVSDNNSDIEQKKNIQEYHLKNDFFLLNLNDVNLGIIGNLYTLNRLADSEYIWFLGDDDVLLPGCIQNIIKVLTEYSVNYLFMNYNSFVDSIDNLVSKTKTPFNGYKTIDKHTACNLFKSCGTAFMFISASIYRKKYIDILQLNHSRNINLAEPLFFFFSACNDNIYIEEKSYILDRLSGISWASFQKQVSFVDIPECILNLYFLERYSDSSISDMLVDYYMKTNSFLFSIYYSSNSLRIRIVRILKSKIVVLSFLSFSFIVRILIKKSFKLLMSKR